MISYSVLLNLHTYKLCITVNCGDPGTPSNGDTEGTVTTFGSIVNHTCNKGYELNGANERECLANGSWSAPLPSCDSKSLYVRYVHI